MAQNRFTPSFFTQPTLKVARALLGAKLVTRVNGIETAGMIVETEAYCGPRDPAAHSARGRTERTEVMFWEGGHCYVYFIYGAHFCVNVVTGREGVGEAVLIRALEPLAGTEQMRVRRGNVSDQQLTSGPGKLCQALAIDKSMYGEHFLRSSRIQLRPYHQPDASHVRRAPRVGISRATEKLWRFYIRDNPWVSVL